MIGGGIILVSHGYFAGGSLGNLFNTWAQAGVFTYILPFLIIFAIIFAVLEKTKLFENRAVKAILALSVGLLAVSQFSLVPQFFSLIFPKLGVGLAIILVVMVVLGFYPGEGENADKRMRAALTVVGIIIAVVIVYTSFAQNNSFLYILGYNVWNNLWNIVFMVVIIGLLIYAVLGGKRRNNNPPPPGP